MTFDWSLKAITIILGSAVTHIPKIGDTDREIGISRRIFFVASFIKEKIRNKQCPLIEDAPINKNETVLYELIGKAL